MASSSRPFFATADGTGCSTTCRPGNGTFHPGKAHFNGQFLVFNVDSGDPSAAHEHATVMLRR